MRILVCCLLLALLLEVKGDSCNSGTRFIGDPWCVDWGTCDNPSDWPRFNSYSECDQFCQSTTGCSHWVWYTPQHSDQYLQSSCWVLKNKNGEEQNSEIISGEVGCSDSNQPGQLIFSEDFDFLDTSRWTHMVTGWRGGNWEFQYYRNNRSNSYTQDGNLHIVPTFTADEYGEDFLYHGEMNLWDQGCRDEWNIDGGCYVNAGGDYIINPIQSARIITKESFSFKFGQIEVRAKLPKGDWLWPAVWLLPRDSVYGGWPRSGEIDIMESRGNDNLMCDNQPYGQQLMGSTLHWGPDVNNNHYYQTHWESVNSAGFANDFHIYKALWDSEGIRFYVDGTEIGSVYPPPGGFGELGGFDGNDNPWAGHSKMAPFDQEFYILINLAVGGNYFPDGCLNEGGEKPWHGRFVPGSMKSFWEHRSDWEPTWARGSDQSALQIDYVRVYSV